MLSRITCIFSAIINHPLKWTGLFLLAVMVGIRATFLVTRIMPARGGRPSIRMLSTQVLPLFPNRIHGRVPKAMLN